MSVDPLAAHVAGEVSPFLINRGTINTVLDAVRMLPSPRGEMRPSSPDGTDQRLPVPHSSVLVRNDTGSAQGAHAILKLGETLQLVSQEPHDIFRLPSFEGATPAAQSDCFAVLLEGAGPGNIAVGAIRGAAVCWVTVSDITHIWAAPDPGSTLQLLSGESGPARILSTPTGTGRQLCAVLIDDRGDRHVRETVDETPLNSEPATEETLYAADEPTTATPAIKQFVAENYTGGGGGNLPGGFIAAYPAGTGSAVAYFLEFTTETVSQTVTIDGSTSEWSYTENAGDITLALSVDFFDLTNVTEMDFTGVTITGFTGGDSSRTCAGEESVAATGTNQGTAATFVGDAVSVSGADGTVGVILKNQEAAIIMLTNTDAMDTLNVYPPSGAAINALGTNNADTIPAGTSKVYLRQTATQWRTLNIL